MITTSADRGVSPSIVPLKFLTKIKIVTTSRILPTATCADLIFEKEHFLLKFNSEKGEKPTVDLDGVLTSFER